MMMRSSSCLDLHSPIAVTKSLKSFDTCQHARARTHNLSSPLATPFPALVRWGDTLLHHPLSLSLFSYPPPPYPSTPLLRARTHKPKLRPGSYLRDTAAQHRSLTPFVNSPHPQSVEARSRGVLVLVCLDDVLPSSVASVCRMRVSLSAELDL